MTADQYVESILAKYAVPRGPMSPAEQLGAAVAGPLRTWAGRQLNALEYSGSYAKETGVHGISDVDVFMSLKSDTTNTLKEIYYSLYSLAQQQGWSPRQQNVSVGVTPNGTRGDLVPGKVQAGYQTTTASISGRETPGRRPTLRCTSTPSATRAADGRFGQ